MASTLVMRTGAPHERAMRLVDAIKAVLNDAIKAGGSSLRDHRQTSGELGMFQHNFRVYDREGQRCPTPGCAGIVERCRCQHRVADGFGEDAAEPEHDARTELRIAHQAGDQLAAAGDLLRDQ